MENPRFCIGTLVLLSALLVWPHSARAACIGNGTVSDINDCLATDRGARDCLLAWSVNFDGSGAPPVDPVTGAKTTTVVCTDGSACDGDGYANGVCSFEIGACVNAGTACSGAALSAVKVRAPSARRVARKSTKDPEAYFTRRTVLDAVGALLGSTAEACTAADLELRVPLRHTRGGCVSPAGAVCSNDQDCSDYCILTSKKSKTVLRVRVDNGGSRRDADTLKFVCLPATAGTQRGAQAFQVSDPTDLIGGPLAMGRVGDWMLRNGNIRVLVRDIGRAFSFMLTNGGTILDADLVRKTPAQDRDSWLGAQAMIHLSSTQATTDIVVLNDGSDGNPAVLRTSGPDDLFDPISPELAIFSAGDTLSVPLDTVDRNLPLQLTTDYILAPGASYLQIATTVENLGSEDLDLYIGDYLSSGGQLEAFGPGLGFGTAKLRLGGSGTTTRPQGLDYLGFQGIGEARGLTYGFVFPRSRAQVGINKFVDGTLLTSALGTVGVSVWFHRQQLLQLLNSLPKAKPTPPFHVAAGGTNTLRRWFVLGKTVADVTAVREGLFGNRLATVQGVVTSQGQPVADAHVAFVKRPGNNCNFAGGNNCVNVYTATLTDDHGFYRAWVVPDTYDVQARGPGFPYEGSAAAPVDHFVTAKARKTATVDIDLPGSAMLRVLVEDEAGNPIAAKVSVVGFQRSPDPGNLDSIAGFADSEGRYFGYDPEEGDDDLFGVAKVEFAGPAGDSGLFRLEPGSYHVVVSHGPEYDLYDERITLTSGTTTTLNATVNHVVDSSGFVSEDAHVHMIESPDSAVTNADRIRVMLAEGIDFFVNTDHDFLHDLADDISALGADGLIANASSDEISTFAQGHFNAWPIVVDPASLTGGALDWGRPGEPVGLGYPADGSFDLLAGEIFASFDPSSQVVQINHINGSRGGYFRNLGLDTELVPPASSASIYRCQGGIRAALPCQAQICLGGSADATACSSDSDCPGGGCNLAPIGRDCLGGACVDQAANLAAFLRLDPGVANLYDNSYTALELWVRGSRSQTDRLLHENLGDWMGLLNQGLFKTGVADSDTHNKSREKPAGLRTYVASATDSPALIDPFDVAAAVNAGRAIGSSAPFVRVELVGDGGATASHALGMPLTVPATAGTATINIHVESPTWAEFDTIDLYINTQPACVSSFTFNGVLDRSCDATPELSLVAGSDFQVLTEVGASGSGQRLVADVSQPLAVSTDTWVIVVVRGSDGVSRPLFPVNPLNLDQAANLTLDDLTDAGAAPPWNLGERGVMATAFTNPLFFDADGNGLCHGETPCP